jgi:5'-methylthioadenosine/S-adenosylhomocysteine nucleosidase
MIGLIAAEKEEVGNLLKEINARIIEFNNFCFYIGSINDKQIIICFSGVGKANAAAATMNMIINFQPTIIINIGMCGSHKPNISVDDLLIVDSLMYCDVDLTTLNYPANQLPNEKKIYPINQSNILLLKRLFNNAKIGALATSDSFINAKNIEQFPAIIQEKILGFDMEATAIAQICNKTNVNFICLKIISDNLCTPQTNHLNQYRNNFHVFANHICQISIKILKYYSNSRIN